MIDPTGNSNRSKNAMVSTQTKKNRKDTHISHTAVGYQTRNSLYCDNQTAHKHIYISKHINITYKLHSNTKQKKISMELRSHPRITIEKATQLANVTKQLK